MEGPCLTLTGVQGEEEEGLNVLGDPKAREGALVQLRKQLSEKTKKDLAQAEHNVLLETGAVENRVALAATDALRIFSDA